MFIVNALFLGLLVALNPCQLAINISALTYLNNKSNSSKEFVEKSWLYALGRTITYSLLGIILMILLRYSLNIDYVQSWLSKGETILPYILIIVGAYLIFRTFHHHEHHGDECHNCGQTIKRTGPSGAIILGLMLAFAFCPESAILYFGMMLPISVANTIGWIVPIFFAIAAAVPVIILAKLIATATEKAQKFVTSFKHFQQWINGILGIAFVGVGILLILL